MPRGWRGTERLRILMLYGPYIWTWSEAGSRGHNMASVASDSAPRRGVPVQHRTSGHVSPSDESQVALRVAVTARLSPELRRRAPNVADRNSDVGPHTTPTRARGGRARLWPYVGAERGRPDIPHRWRCALGVEKFN
jgi:hypothetical protein